MGISTITLVNQTFTIIMRDILRRWDNRLVGPLSDVKITYDPISDSAFTHSEGERKFRINIGGKLIRTINDLPSEFETLESFRPAFNKIVSSFYGLDFHEMAHILFTDMSDRAIVDYPKPEYRNFLHQLFNLMEDPVAELDIENLFTREYPFEINPRKYFDYNNHLVFDAKCEDYSDDGSLSSFMNYLLLILRCGKTAIKNPNAIWEKYQEDLLPRIRDVIMTSNPTTRLKNTIVLGEWMIDNIHELHFETLYKPREEEILSGKMPEGVTPMPGGDVSSIAGRMKATGTPSTETKAVASIHATDGTPSEKSSEDASKDDAPGEGAEKEKEVPEVLEKPEDDPAITNAFNEGFELQSSHEWVVAKDTFDYTERTLDLINESLSDTSDMTRSVSKFLNLFHSRQAPRQDCRFSSGKLNLAKAISNEMRGSRKIDIFSRTVPRGGRVPDLAVTLVCDNSGSMSGDKSIICSTAALALAQACDWSKIPFECYAFTKTNDDCTGICKTIVIKNFDDTFKESKPYFGINSSKIIKTMSTNVSVPTFYGNSEEVNLYYIWKHLQSVKHELKLVFVLCDGMTTGSANDLQQVIKDMEADDIVVIGLGIYNNDVEHLYSKHQVFATMEDLQQNLASYLIDTLSQYAK